MMRTMQQQVNNYLMKQKYICQVYNALQSFLYCLLIWILFMTLIALISLSMNILILFPIGFVCSLTLPFIFQKKIKRFFTKDALLEFDDLSFCIELRKLKNNKVIKESKYNWNDIKAYKFYFTPSKLTYLDIYLKNGSWSEFGFKDNKTEDESINSESIISTFRAFVRRYNSEKEQNDKIILRPGFLTTASGTFFMLCVAVLILTAIIFALIKSPKSLPFLLMSIFIFIPLVIKRRQDKKFYEKMNKLE